jgi:hypothetical protein
VQFCIITIKEYLCIMKRMFLIGAASALLAAGGFVACQQEAAVKPAPAKEVVEAKSEEEDGILSYDEWDAQGTLTELTDLSVLPTEAVSSPYFIRAYRYTADVPATGESEDPSYLIEYSDPAQGAAALSATLVTYAWHPSGMFRGCWGKGTDCFRSHSNEVAIVLRPTPSPIAQFEALGTLLSASTSDLPVSLLELATPTRMRRVDNNTLRDENNQQINMLVTEFDALGTAAVQRPKFFNETYTAIPVGSGPTMYTCMGGASNCRQIGPLMIVRGE